MQAFINQCYPYAGSMESYNLWIHIHALQRALLHFIVKRCSQDMLNYSFHLNL